MQPAKLLFVLVLALGGLLVVALLSPEPTGSQGLPHPELGSMLSGGSGAERHGPILWLGWAFGAVQIAFFGALLALAVDRRGTSHGAGRLLAWGTTVYLLAWTALVWVYGGGMGDPEPSLWLGLPPSTALMIFVLWPAPLSFVGLFVFGFRRWVLTDEDRETFAQLVEQRRLDSERAS